MLREALSAGADGEQGTRQRWIVIVDQLEELFTLCTDEKARRDFLDILESVAQAGSENEDPAGLVVFGLRSDFFTPCADYPQLRTALQDSPLVVGPMSKADVRPMTMS